MMRRVLILSTAYPPSSAVGAFRAARFAKYLPDYGWQPIVLTTEPDASAAQRDESRMQWVAPDTIVVRTQRSRLLADRLHRSSPRGHSASGESRADVAFNAPREGQAAGIRSRLRRLASIASLPFRIPDKNIWWARPALRALRESIKQYAPEVLLSTSPPHSTHLIAMACKALTGIAVVMDLRDPWAHTEWAEARQGCFKSRMDRMLERWCVARADQVILNTPELLTDFGQHYPNAWQDRFSAIPNGFDPEVREHIETLTASAPGVHNQPLRVCHAGAVYGRRDIRPLVEAIALVNRRGRRVVFEQVGTLADPRGTLECVEKFRARECVEILSQQPHDEALRRQAAADILVVVRQNTGLQVPAKLYEMMLFGKPLLVLDGEGAMTRLVREYDLGVVADPEDPVAIAAAIDEAAGRIGAVPSARRAAALAKFDAREQTRELADVLAAAVESRRRSRR